MPVKILLIDDDKEFRKEFKACFSEYDITEAGSGLEALDILKRPNEIDLTMLDVRMPGTDWSEVLTNIKKIAPDMGVVIMTGYSSEDVAIKALKAHADDYLEKPVNVNNTKDIIEKVVIEKNNRRSKFGTLDEPDKISRVKDFLERNCYKNVGLEDAASHVALSAKYLSRAFKEKTGKTFNFYRLGIKMREAKGLLKKTSSSVYQISDRIGYENVESFIRMFRKTTGQTPTEYRKANTRSLRATGRKKS